MNADEYRFLYQNARDRADNLSEWNARLRAELDRRITPSQRDRLRAELAEARRVSDEWAKAHGARSAETSIARDEIDRLRAELDAVADALNDAEIGGRTLAHAVRDLTAQRDGHDIRAMEAEQENSRLRAELTRSQADEVEHRIEAGKLRAELSEIKRTAAKDIHTLGAERDRLRAELDEVTEWAAQSDAEKMNHCATIARVRSVLDEYESEPATGEMYPLWKAVRAALGEQNAG